MNFYAFTWMMIGMIYVTLFGHAPTWLQYFVGLVLGLVSGMWPAQGKGESL